MKLSNTFEMQPFIFEEGRFVFEEKSDHFRFLAVTDLKICVAMTYSWNVQDLAK